MPKHGKPHGPESPGPEPRFETNNPSEIKPGDLVRVYTAIRNDPTQFTLYKFEGLVKTDQGEKAKLSFTTSDGKRFVRLADYRDLLPA